MSTAQVAQKDEVKGAAAPVLTIPSDAREVFEKYSGIPPDDVVHHVTQVRDHAYAIFPYDTIGQGIFLNFYTATHPQYDHVLSRLCCSSHKLLDMACCFGQEIRKMVYDGAPSASLYGIDIEPAFIALGYELFKDEEKLRSTFIAADIFDLNLGSIQGEIDIILVKAFFHLFSWERQVLAVRVLISILKPRPGSMVMGMNLGSIEPAEHDLKPGGPKTFRHSPDTFAELWREAAGDEAGLWKVDGSADNITMVGNEHASWAEPNMRRLVFTVTRQ